MTSLQITEHKIFDRAQVLIQSEVESERWEGVDNMMLLALNGQTLVADWAMKFMKAELNTNIIREIEDAAPTKADCLP